MAEKLKVYQIYYSDKTKENCFHGRDWWIPYNNEGNLTPFFENEVINRGFILSFQNECEYLGVFSHDIAQEIKFKEGNLSFSPENLRSVIGDHDVYSFQKRRHQKNIVLQAENYHPGIVEYTKKILGEIGYDLPKKLDKIVLFNHFVMRPDIYEEYYNQMLGPAIEVMSQMDELHKDAGYRRLSGKKANFTLTDNQGNEYSHYPYHPFICERLVSVWLQYNNYSFKHIF